LIVAGVRIAWSARDKNREEEALAIDKAARLFAKAKAVFVRVIFEGIVFYLVGEGIAGVAKRIGPLVARLQRSKFLRSFAKRLELDYKKLIDDPKLNSSSGEPGTGGSGAGAGNEGPKPSEPPGQMEKKPPSKADVEASAKQRAKRTSQSKLKEGIKKAEAEGKFKKLKKADQDWINEDATGRRKDLSYDPDTKSFKPKEAKAALRAEQEGVLDGPVERAIDENGRSGGDDIVDGNGKGWDIKDARTGADGITEKAAPKGDKPGENVLVDCSDMSPSEQKALEADVASKQQPGGGEIRFVPKR